LGRVDFITGTFGKALGGAGGAYIASHKEVIDYLRQRSRTSLFSNSLDTGVAGASLFALNHVQQHPELGRKLRANAKLFREEMTKASFTVNDSAHPITPV